MATQETTRLYSQDFEGIFDITSNPDYFQFPMSNIELYGDFRAVRQLMTIAESLRDNRPVDTLTGALNAEKELALLSAYSLGVYDPRLEEEVVAFAQRHPGTKMVACNLTEVNFIVSAKDSPVQSILNGIVYLSDNGEPFLFQKGWGEKTAIGLGAICVRDSEGSEVIYPRGWLYDPKISIEVGPNESETQLKYVSRRVKANDDGLVSVDGSAIQSLRPLRASLFTPKSPEALEVVSRNIQLDIDMSLHTIDWFIKQLSS